MVARADWAGILESRRWRAEVVLDTPLAPSKRGGSGAFLGLGSDGRRYWIKVTTGPQGPRVPVTEQLVGRAGALIGAPTCEVRTVYVPKALTGWEYRPGHLLEPGWAHGSLAISDSVEEEKNRLAHRDEDENAQRHPGYYALFDWCWGDDVQCLLDLSDDRRCWSHDHGYFLPPGGKTWSESTLSSSIDDAHELAIDGGGVDAVSVDAVAEALEGVNRQDLAELLQEIPRAWTVTDQELEAVGYFLERRAAPVAGRLRARLGGGT